MNDTESTCLPIVCITTDRGITGVHPTHSTGEKYITAVIEGSQALALLLPSVGPRQPVDQILSLADGIVFTGSYSNVDPRHYQGTESEPGTLHDPDRDATALPLMVAAIEAGMPVLAICRGFQEMNVAFGGSLHQSVHTRSGFADHRERQGDAIESQYADAHEIQLTPGGTFERLFAARGLVGPAYVNSLHAQGIDRLGKRLSIEARALDGLIEAISVRDAPAFALGVQWHPEWMHTVNPVSSAIFEALGHACRERRRKR